MGNKRFRPVSDTHVDYCDNCGKHRRNHFGGFLYRCDPMNEKGSDANDPGHGDFSIGSTVWPGVSKLIEECGEVSQVCGKLIGSRGNPDHWDGSNLKKSLEEEVADLLAAIRFVMNKNSLDRDFIVERAAHKLRLFKEWHETNGIQGTPVTET